MCAWLLLADALSSVGEEHHDGSYQRLGYIDRATTERALDSDDEREVAEALLAASFEDADPSWVFDRCMVLAGDARLGIRWAVALAIGHLAIPGGFVDERAVHLLQELGADPAVRPAVSTAVDDVEQALVMRQRPT